ncbi:MAG TPA: hypothetical protein VMF11_14125 [Candidatus Baltobacteraceae bacterium]|nr:hypothetical protein [Candidatus Baltobacteraceae bacterium]
MGEPGPASLRFGRDVSPTTRARIDYAFRTFCAIYGLRPTLRLYYGGQGERREGEVVLPALYVARPPSEPAPPPKTVALAAHAIYDRLGLRATPVFHADARSVDWLGEIFEWISHADEYSVTERDDVGRVPFAASLHGRYGLDPTIPYASIAMLELARSLGLELPSGPSLIAASHDLDYLPTSALGNARRLLKNVAIAMLVDRDPALAAQIVLAGLRGMLRGRSPLDCIPTMLVREARREIASTSYVICRNGCARDANYTLSDPRIQRTLQQLQGSGGELGVHVSYMSLPDGTLGDEVRALRASGFRVEGVRAHWIRYAGGNLFEAIEQVGDVKYDTTVCFAERVGFRSGASFVYRPYRFASERPYSFYELPLAIMDGALRTHARAARVHPRMLCSRVLDMIDAFPGGAASVLWHNTVFEGAQLPGRVGALYWELPRPAQRWTTAIAAVNARRHSLEQAFEGEPAVCS